MQTIGEIVMIIHAPAKINLVLDVVSKRADGYHNVKMIMQTLELGDSVTVEAIPSDDTSITITSNSDYVPCNESNIAYKAAVAILDSADKKCHVKIHIEKNIPVAAGLAGGSTDGAAVLSGLNDILNLGYSCEKLMKLGAKFGADVPFCTMQGTALAEGTGTELKQISPYGEHVVLLVKPDIGVSTPWVYKNLKLDTVEHPDVDKYIECISNGEFKKSFQYMGNVLESVTVAEYPIIDKIKKQMTEQGALISMMSGSGPTVFGIFDNKTDAEKAAEFFKKEFKEVIVTKTV